MCVGCLQPSKNPSVPEFGSETCRTIFTRDWQGACRKIFFWQLHTRLCVCVHTSAHAGQRCYVTFNSLFFWELFCVSVCALGAHKNVFTQMFACVVCLEFFLPGRYIFARLLEFIFSLCLCLSLSLSPTALAVTSKAWLLWKEPYHWLDAPTPTSFPLRVSLRQPLWLAEAVCSVIRAACARLIGPLHGAGTEYSPIACCGTRRDEQ